MALIPDEDWQKGPAHVAQIIAEIERSHQSHRRENSIDEQISSLPSAPGEVVLSVRSAMQSNREALPPTFDAITGLIVLEIERLQGRNIADDFDRDETPRQISILLALHEAICALREQLPGEGAVTLAQAEKSEGVLRLYAKKFGELPRAKADEVVDGVWATGRSAVRAGLIGATAALGVSYGLPAMAGVAIGSLVFAPKNSAEIIKAAKELLSGK